MDGKLQANEVQRLRELANNELRLDRDTAADIEREVMGDTIETILERQEQAARVEERNRQLAPIIHERSGGLRFARPKTDEMPLKSR
jgi:hypothetical protein